jgi:hemerythrin superfamily protein
LPSRGEVRERQSNLNRESINMANSVEHIKAKVAGVAGAVEARIKGLKGVFRKLAEQHHEVGSLLSTLKSTDDPSKRGELWTEIRRELVSHEQAELLRVYPVIEGYESIKGLAYQHTNAASELEAAIQTLDLTDAQSEAWQPALERLIVAVDAHARLEEEELFPRAQEALGDDVTGDLEASFVRAKHLAEERLG